MGLLTVIMQKIVHARKRESGTANKKVNSSAYTVRFQPEDPIVF